MSMKKGNSGFGARLKQIRESAGLTQDQLAESAGLNKFGLAKLEQGVSEPHWPTVLALAHALGVTCDSFMEPPAKSDAEPRRGRPPKPRADEPASSTSKPRKRRKE
jgi:transcriptional regulator with XRE-family HTH domain